MLLQNIARVYSCLTIVIVAAQTAITLVLFSCSGSPTEAQNVASISITPQTHVFTRMDQSIELTAQAFDEGGNLIPNKEFTWQASNNNIVEITPSEGDRANVVPKANGSVTITAESDGKTGNASLEVKVVSSVTLTPDSHVFKETNQTQQFQATANGPDGNPVMNITFSWRSTNENTATVDANGTVTSLASGNTFIIVTYDEGSFQISDSAEVVVDLIPPVTGDWSGAIPGLGFILSLTENNDASISGDGSVLIASGGAVLVFGVSVSGSREQENITLLITSPVINPTTFIGVINLDNSQSAKSSN